MTADLAGRRAIVTGASRGIGAAIARRLDAAGARTMLVARSRDALTALAAALSHATPVVEDLLDAGAAARVAAGAAGALGGPPDILVNNAGVFVVAPLESTTDAEIDSLFHLNVTAPARLLRALLPVMRERRTGHIVTIGSVADRKVYPGSGMYAASKFAGRALHESTRAETRGTGIRATLVSPGPVDTAIWDPYDPDHRPGFTPRAEMLRPGHVADAVLWALTQPPAVNVDELRLTPV